MQITHEESGVQIISLETEAGQYAFYAGRTDHRMWQRSPETIELSQHLQTNLKNSQIVVKCNDSFTRVR